MTFKTLPTTASLVVGDYRCAAKSADRPFVQRHGSLCLAYVRRGSFGCSTRGRSHELVAGSMFIGHPGDEYACNFIRTFHRAARVSPRTFRRMARNDRNLVRERLARHAMR